MTKHNECPACSHVKGNKVDAKQVYTCAKCQAIFHNSGTMYLGTTYEYVLPYWAKDPNVPSVYFDFSYLGSDGPGRRHGWFDPSTKHITQTG